MVFDLPLFHFEPTDQANPRIVSVVDASPSAMAEGGSKTPPYFGTSSLAAKNARGTH
jgi:hypothetical protein